MHCIIYANDKGIIPQALRPMKGRAVMDYLIDDALRQKDITTVMVIAHKESLNLITKHLRNAFPNHSIQVVDTENSSNIVSRQNDTIILQGNVVTSLKLNDFIRYFKQFKTVTKAAYDKQNPKEIPFCIVPKKRCGPNEIHTFNCGTGYCYTI